MREFPQVGQSDETVDGRARPEKIRQTGRQFQVADAIVFPGQSIARNAFKTEHKLRAGKNGLKRRPDSTLEISIIAACLIETQKALDVAISRRFAESLTRQRRYNLLRARDFIGACRWTANENLAAPRRVR